MHHACKYHFPNTSLYLLMKASSEKKKKIFMIFHSEKRHSHKGAPSINHHPFGSKENGGRLVQSGKGLVAEVSVILKENTCLCFARRWRMWTRHIFLHFFWNIQEHPSSVKWQILSFGRIQISNMSCSSSYHVLPKSINSLFGSLTLLEVFQ